MRKLFKEFRSEKGAASVLEATIVFPIVFLTVIFLIYMGFIHVQKAYVQYHADHLSLYISKMIQYPGYQYIDKPYYTSGANNTGVVTFNDISNAMKCSDPYRYFMGLFNKNYKIADHNSNRNVVKEAAEGMVNNYLASHGFLKPSNSGKLSEPTTGNFAGHKELGKSDGYICAIAADTSKVSVYLAQDFVFAKFFSMIGIGGRTMAISGVGTTFITDSVEFMRNTDMIFDAANFLADKLGIDIAKIKDVISKITGNENK